jgi:hypothetical protein
MSQKISSKWKFCIARGALESIWHGVVCTPTVNPENFLLLFIGSSFLKRLIRFLSRSNNCLLAYEKTKADGCKIHSPSYSTRIKSDRHQFTSTHERKWLFCLSHFSSAVLDTAELLFLRAMSSLTVRMHATEIISFHVFFSHSGYRKKKKSGQTG